MDIESTINALLAALLPAINKQLPSFMQSEGLDPLDKVVSDTITLGKINLGVCTAKAKASYDIKDMKGLSSLQIDTMVLDTIDSQDNLSNVTGTLSLSVKLNSDLTAKVSGNVKASCSIVSEKVGISGKVTAKSVTGKGKATFSAGISSSTSCLNDVTITSLSLNYKDVDVKIDDLGIFNEFLDPLVDAVNDLFGSYIKDALAPVVQKELNKLIDDIVPMCV